MSSYEVTITLPLYLIRVADAHDDLPPPPAGHLLCQGLGAAGAVQASPSPLQAVCQSCRVCGNNLVTFNLINFMLNLINIILS